MRIAINTKDTNNLERGFIGMHKARLINQAKKVCAWVLSVATLSTTIVPSSMVYASRYDPDDTPTETVIDDVDTELGNIFVQIPNTGGKVTVTSESAGKQTVSIKVNKAGDRVASITTENKDVSDSDADEETTEKVTLKNDDDYVLELKEEIGSNVTTEVESNEGYVIKSYSICSTKGKELEEVDDLYDGDTEYERDVEVEEKDKVIEISFEEEGLDDERALIDEEIEEPAVDIDDEIVDEEIGGEEIADDEVVVDEEEEIRVEDPVVDDEVDNPIADVTDSEIDETSPENDISDEGINDIPDISEGEETGTSDNEVTIPEDEGLEVADEDFTAEAQAKLSEDVAESRAGAGRRFTFGSKYLSEIFTIDREKYYDWLEYNMDPDTSIYLGTRYDEVSAGTHPNGDPGQHKAYRVNGTKYQVPNNVSYAGSLGTGTKGMNCTGFVWHVLQMAMSASGATDKMHQNLMNLTWHSTMNPDLYAGDANGWCFQYYRYVFNSYDDMLNSGVLEFGDIIWSLYDRNNPGNNPDDHIGIYVGNENPDTPKKYNRYWHSGHTSRCSSIPTGNIIGNISDGYGNMISNIVPKTETLPGQWAVIKMFPDEPDESNGKLRVHKKSALPGITDDNDCYSLANAKYGIYTDEACTNKVDTLITKESGYSNWSKKLDPGRYYIKEIKAPGTYKVDREVYPAKVKDTGDPDETVEVTKNVTEFPKYDPAGVSLTKANADDTSKVGGSDFAGAKFLVQYYDAYSIKSYLANNPSVKPTRQWVYQTGATGLLRLTNKNNIVSSVTIGGKSYRSDAPFVDEDGDVILPRGSYVVTEIEAPPGYLINNDVFYGSVSSGEDGSQHFNWISYSGNMIEVPNKADTMAIPEKPAFGGFKTKKYTESDEKFGDVSVKGTTFTIINNNDFEVPTLNDKKVMVGKGEEVGTIVVEDESGLAKTADDALLAGDYIVYESAVGTGLTLDDTRRPMVVEASKVTDWTDKVKGWVNEEIKGGVRVRKFDWYTQQNFPQGDAEFIGTEFTIYNRSKNRVPTLDGSGFAEGSDGITGGAAFADKYKVGTIVVNGHSGWAQTEVDALYYGHYEIRETKSTLGYHNNGFDRVFIVDSEGFNEDKGPDAVNRRSFDVYDKENNNTGATNKVYTGGVWVEKKCYTCKTNHPSGDLAMNGFEFTIYNLSTHAVNKIDAEGNRIENEWVYPKGQPNEDGTESDGIVGVIKTNENGLAKTKEDALAYGRYRIEETKAATGWKNDGFEAEFTITEQQEELGGYIKFDNKMLHAPDDHYVRGGIEVEKRDFELNRFPNKEGNNVENNEAQGDGTLQDVHFLIINRSEHGISLSDDDEDDQRFKPGEIVKIIKTKYVDTNGDGIPDMARARTGQRDLPYGTYGVQEVPADCITAENEARFDSSGNIVDSKGNVMIDVNGNPVGIERPGLASTGYLWSDGKERTVKITENDDNVYKKIASDGKQLIFENNPVRGGMKLEKMDEDFKRPGYAQGDATLEGAVFAIKNISVSPEGKQQRVKVGDTLYNYGDICLRIRTDAQGNATTGAEALPYGTYEVWEESPSQGYRLDKDFRTTFQIRTHGEMIKLSEKYRPCYEPVIRGDVMIEKWDVELDKSEAIGGKDHGNHNTGAHLDGAVFEIRNLSKHAVMVDGKEFPGNDSGIQPPVVVKTITSHWNERTKSYTAETTGQCLPYGTYSIKEIKAPEGYKLSDAPAQIFEIREHGKVVKVDREGNDLVVKNQIIRGDVRLEKVAFSNMKRLHVPFVIENVTSGERHVFVTDINGEYNSASHWNEHLYKTNANDRLLEYGDEEIPESELDDTAGIWFGLGEDGSMADPKNELGALPYGEYIIRELRCETNREYDLVEFVFHVFKDTVSDDKNYHDGNIDLGTILDQDRTSQIKTRALDKETKDHISLAGDKVTIIDTVHCTNIIKGREYTLKATLMNYKDEDEPFKINGKKITGQVTFTATSAVMDVEVPITFDGTGFEGNIAVVFEELYLDGEVVAEHKELEDKDQTVEFPEIHTTATDKETGEHIGHDDEYVVVRDVVSFNNLIPNKNYVMKGQLYDKETEEAFGEIVEKPFTPSESSGSVELEFRIKAEALEGKTYVAFEKLYYNDKLIGIHADIEDEDQSVHYPKIRTTAIDENSGTHTGTVAETSRIIDTVHYENLIPGKEYTVRGILMDKATEHPLHIGGFNHDIIAETTFTPDTPSGDVDVVFEIDSRTIAGKSVVVFETLYFKNVKVAAHTDITDEGQEIDYPKIKTNANDGLTEDESGKVGETTIVDTVSYNNLIVGKEYTITGTLMDKDTGRPLGEDKGIEPIKASNTFTAETKDGTVDLIYVVDSSLLSGKTAVVFEDLLVGDKVVYSHADINDKDQTVYYPEIGTTALGKDTGLHEVVASKKQTIVDTVSYNNLVPGKEYVVKGKLIDKATGELLDVEEGNTAEKTFTPNHPNGYVELEFTFDASALENTTTVVFEDLYHNGVLVATHSDIEDLDQTVRIPGLHTNAEDIETGTDEGLAKEEVTIRDVVSYNNLEVGKEYTVTGILMDKETGQPLRVNGDTVVTKETFTPEKPDGEVVLEFTFNASALEGKTVVAFEELFHEGKKVGIHADINDENQDVKYPKIGTTATDKDSEQHVGEAKEDTTIVDVVSYNNLTVGKTYKISGKLMDKKTGKPIEVEHHQEVVAEKEFTPEKPDGTITLEFTFDSSAYKDSSIVVFEELYRDDKLIAIHTDIEDEGQTVDFPAISTNATDKVSGSHEGIPGEMTTIVDRVFYKNLMLGHEYKVSGVLMDKVSGEELRIDGRTVKAEKTFIAGPEGTKKVDDDVVTHRVDGYVDLEFTFNSSALQGESVVVFEDLYKKDKEIAIHHDINDDEQTVTYPDIKTTATDKETGSHDTQDGKEVTIVDTVEYTGLKPGKEYTMSGMLMVKSTNKPLVVNGNPVVSEKKFTPEKPDGTVELEFKFNSTELAGESLVVFENCYDGDILVAAHADINDEDQTVTVVDLKTTAKDKVSGTHKAQASGKTTIVDTVKYTGLRIGKEYTVKGTLMDKETGNKLLANGSPVTAEASFIAKEANGEIEIEFVFDSSALAGKTIVVFEDLYVDKIKVATHSDLTDEGQSVNIVDIKTTATDEQTDTKKMTVGKEVKLKDVVKYWGLTPGHHYTLKGSIVDKVTQTEIGVFSKEEFVPKDPNGSVNVIFTLDTTTLAGKSLVVFEELWDHEGNLIVDHKDIDDKDQTVEVPGEGEPTPTPENPKDSPTPKPDEGDDGKDGKDGKDGTPGSPGSNGSNGSSGSSGGSSSSGTSGSTGRTTTTFAKTGENMMIVIGGVLCVIVAAGLFVGAYKRKKRLSGK